MPCLFLFGTSDVGWCQGTPAASEQGGDARDGKKPSLAELLMTDAEREFFRTKKSNQAAAISAENRGLPVIDDEILTALGIRKLTSNHLILYTDLPRDPFVDEIPKVFDLAVAKWAEYFQIDASAVSRWQVAGSLIQSEEKFKTAKLLPSDLPPFLHGFQKGRQFWVYEQESPYYRRHLVLHEGVHAFMFHALGGAGPPWYREGVAEFLGTHQWKNGELKVGYMPQRRDEVPYWGRVRILKREYAAGRPLMLREVMRFPDDAHLKIEPYAWCWAAAAFLDGNLRYRGEFRKMKDRVADNTALFSRDFENALRAQSRELDEEWQLFIANIDYGYDFRRNAVRYQGGAALPKDGRTVTISTDLGWQSTGIRMEKGKSYVVAAKGRYRVRQHPKDWWCEPGGITIEYANGLPLGILLGNIRRDEPLPGAAGLVQPVTVGVGRRISAAGDGTLYLRVNESAGGLSDNSGQITVKVKETTDDKADLQTTARAALAK